MPGTKEINILDNAYSKPTIELTFPLPTDSKAIISLEANEAVSNSFDLVGNFIKFFSGINYDDIYADNEGKYSINKHSKKFDANFHNYLNERLSKTDEKLDEIVYKLVDQELRMKLIDAKEFPIRFKKVKDFMIKYYQQENEKNMPSFPHNRRFIRIAYITVIKTLSKMFPNGIWVDEIQFNNLFQKYLEDPMSIIFLPNHQSHIDYIILHIITVRFQMSVPTVIAGENLNVAIFGKLLKNLGAIFIKRTFNNELYTERNLANMIEYVLMNKIHLEVFIEGTRARDGKLLVPKYGILKTLTQIYLHQRNVNKVADFNLLLQPVAITYERIYETDGFVDELMGKDKKQESFASIMKNGISNLVYGLDKDDEEQHKILVQKGTYDNSTKQLHGKVYLQLGESFRLSEFIENGKLAVDDHEDDEGQQEEGVNLKKLGFKVLHEINRVSVLPEVSLVGCSIQVYHYISNQFEFSIQDVIPVFRLLVQQLSKEKTSVRNSQLFAKLTGASDAEITQVFQNSLIKFFRYIKVNKRNKIEIVNAIELLYYKNLAMHLIIHKCLLCFILSNTNCYNQINKLFYIFTGFLKHEFLFDYNDNERNELTHLLNDLIGDGVIDQNYGIKDRDFIETLSCLIKPFVESYMICTKFLIVTSETFYANIGSEINEQQLINDDLMSKDYPTTKTLLKLMASKKDKTTHIEAINKQYLLSCLFYYNNLKLIKIFKNKSKTKAFVIIKNLHDLKVIFRFLEVLLKGNSSSDKVDEILVNYMIDIIDKNDERSMESNQTAVQNIAKL